MFLSRHAEAILKAIVRVAENNRSSKKTDLWPQIRPLLYRVERPSRYIDSEWGVAEAQDYRVGLCYPDTYEVGQANQALALLYQAANSLDGVSGERIFLPWIDLSDLMRKEDIELFTLESFMPVSRVDILGITIPYELSYTSILEVLSLAHIPFRAKYRDDSYPLVIGGGPCVFNPEPLADFFDAFLIGEGEEAWKEIISTDKTMRAQGKTKQEILEKLVGISGVYVPSFYDVSYREDGRISTITPTHGAPDRVYKRVVTDMETVAPIQCPIVPYVDVVHNRYTLEILRGCTRGCRFCQAGMTYRPVRERSADSIVKNAIDGLRDSGYDEISLTSLSSADHSQLEEVVRRLQKQFEGSGVSVSLPSLRVDAFSIDMAHLMAQGGRKTGLTFAPEAGSQRLRDVINKNVTEEQLLETVERAFKAGWRRIKLYFMIGLPTETDEDIAAIGELAGKVLRTAKKSVEPGQRGGITVGVSVSTLVPKSHTPFQWEPQATDEEIHRKQRVLRDFMPRKGVNLSWHDADISFLEGVIARGDRRLSPVLEAAWRNGARFDAWSEQFSLKRWLDAFEECAYNPAFTAHRARDYDEVFPWAHLSTGVSDAYLVAEAKKAREEVLTQDCSFDSCTGCGACQTLDVDIVLGGEKRQ
ncbi:MAG: TIGR03960 family B12-binding radical SAM protein [Coriobacteriia bacterium]|nr:TIGR03960 family B12-binding radical SAM protein [Coriobacteriia bacterium]